MIAVLVSVLAYDGRGSAARGGPARTITTVARASIDRVIRLRR